MALKFKNREEKKRRKAPKAPKNIANHNVVSKRSKGAKVIVTLAAFASFLFIALVVGNADYKATVVGWAAFLTLFVLVIVSLIYSKLLARSLSVFQAENTTECKRGQLVKFFVTFKNSSPLFFFRIKAHFYVADASGNIIFDEKTTLALSAFETYDLGFDVQFEHVGTYLAGVYSVEVGDFLGLFSNAIAVSSQSTINVIPQVRDIASMQLSTDALRENMRAAKTVMADSMDYSHVRQYVPGDPLKTIHWKLSARTNGGYMTKLYELATNPGCTVILDFTTPDCSVPEAYSIFDCIVETAFSVDNYARSKGFESEILFVDADGARRNLVSWNEDILASVVRDMPTMTPGFEDAGAVDLIVSNSLSRDAQNNLIVCTADLGPSVISALLDAKAARRNPVLFAVAPNKLAGRQLDKWCKPLAQLQASGISYTVLQSSDKLQGGAF